MTRERLEAIGQHWQKVLRLEHWDIAYRLVRSCELESSQGRCSARTTKWQALIQVVDPIDAPNISTDEFPQDVERTIVHELLHLHFWHCGLKADTPEGDAEERAIDRLSYVLVGLHRAPTEVTSDAPRKGVRKL